MKEEVKAIIINKEDNVAVAVNPIKANEEILLQGSKIRVLEDINTGHKFSIKDICKEEDIIKYGFSIGHATTQIKKGSWVHTHNVKTNLDGELEYTYEPSNFVINKSSINYFNGFVRHDGNVGIRNEIWIIPTVGCVNSIAKSLVDINKDLVKNTNIDGIYTFVHPYGCSQMGDDFETTIKILKSLSKHPNAGGVLILSLGCENASIKNFEEIKDMPNIRFLVCQECNDEIEEGSKVIKELIKYANSFKREKVPISKLIVGMKCGGSDGLSGITANPTVGCFSDTLISQGGSTILTETPEMFGAETILMNRCVDKNTFDKTVNMINNFKNYFLSHGQVVYENPSPGNKAGGITTLEDKSLGCVQKGGKSQVRDVIEYGEKVKNQGLTLLSGPGNDLVSTTALTVAGAQIILFTTGRGTPFGAPAPTVKISTNNKLYKEKSNWIDFNAGCIVDGKSINELANDLLEFVIKIANGEIKTKNEQHGYREIAIFKDGITL